MTPSALDHFPEPCDGCTGGPHCGCHDCRRVNPTDDDLDLDWED